MGAAPSITSNAQTAMLQAMSTGVKQTPHDKARATAVEFEAMFLNSMLSEMFTGIEGAGSVGGGEGAGVWRSLLTDEYAKSMAKAGGLGIADQVYRSLLTLQEASGV